MTSDDTPQQPAVSQNAPQLVHQHGEAGTIKYGIPTTRNLFSTKTPTVGPGADLAAKAEEIRQYFHCTFEIYEKVFECLNSHESFTIPPVHKLRHPLIFYYGHTATFYINKLVVAGLTTRINPKFEEMFAVGVDEMSWDDLNEAHYNWPTVEEVSAYRQQVRDRVDQMCKSGRFQLKLPLTFNASTTNDHNAFWWVMLMGTEHERIHLETASVHVRELPAHLVNRSMSSFWRRCPHENEKAPTNEMVEVQGGKVSLGRPFDSPAYGWDCDYSDGTDVDVAQFKASKYIVSNAEFFAFMKADGYKQRRFWDEEGWGWVQFAQPSHPWFWVKRPESIHGYKLRLQVDEIDLPWDWPVELNHLEAKAFCAFKSELTGKRLRMLTEAEWMLLRDRYVKQDQYEWGVAPGNLNLEHYQSSCPVNEFPQGPFYDVVGNVWQHCETPVYPYKGYKVHPFYDDFSMPTFDGRHSVMKGGAWISTGNEATRDARFAFRRHFFQFIGLRYVEGEEVNERQHLCNVLGLDPEVDAATHFAFETLHPSLRNASEDLANYALQLFQTKSSNKPRRSLDLGCGAGRVTFELTALFGEAIGSDFTARKLIPAFSLRERGQATYSVPQTNGTRKGYTVNSSDYPWNATREKAYFYQADPSNLHAHMNGFDLIIVRNVLERSYRPSAIPAHLVSRLNSGGILIIASSYDWSEQFTAKEEWLSSSSPSDDRVPADVIKTLVGDSVTFLEQKMVPICYPTSATEGVLKLTEILAFKKH